MASTLKRPPLWRLRLWQRVLTWCLVVAASSLLGCSKPEPWEREEPEEALKVFMAALSYRDLETVWAFLGPEDQAILTARAAALEASAPNIKRSPWLLLNPGHVIAGATQIKNIKTLDEITEGKPLRVEITPHSGEPFEMVMIRREGRWYVDLPLEALSTPSSSPSSPDKS